MAAEPPQSPVTEGVRSLEVRWIFPGQLDTAVVGWFGRFPAAVESREDTYLPGSAVARAVGEGPRRRGTGGEGVPREPGNPGSGRTRSRTHGVVAEVVLSLQPAPPGQRRPGRLETGTQAAANQPVLTGLRADAARAPGLGGEPRCEVELTEVRTSGRDWWTLGFEATGPADLLRSELQATAALVFAQALPGGVEPGPDESRSYAEWLCLRPSAESDADA